MSPLLFFLSSHQGLWIDFFQILSWSYNIKCMLLLKQVIVMSKALIIIIFITDLEYPQFQSLGLRILLHSQLEM